MRIPKKGTWLNKLKDIVNGKNLDKNIYCKYKTQLGKL